MVDITNDKQLETLMMIQLTEIINEVTFLLLEKLEDNIQKYVYARKRKPAKYKRRKWNGGLLEEWEMNSAVARGRKATAEISENPEVMHNVPEKYVHGSLYNKKYGLTDVREFISKMIIEGTSGDIFGDGYWMQERDFWSPTMKLLENGWIEKQIEKSFRKRGIKFQKVGNFRFG